MLACLLVDEFALENIVVFTHGACAIALVAALAEVDVKKVEPAAPCGVYKLTQTPLGWDIVQNGVTAHLSDLGYTRPWHNMGGGNEWTGPAMGADSDFTAC